MISAKRKIVLRDVVFLLDGSDGTRSGFPAMKDFVLRVMEKLNVAEDKDRVSVVQFSRDPETHFYLNTYTRKDDIVDTVSVLRHKGGRPLNTGAALQYVRDNVFTASSGSRRLEGVPQILILLSGARSFDNVDVPASALKDLGVLIFTIGSRGSDSRELSALSVTDFANLPTVQEQLFSRINTVRRPLNTGAALQYVRDNVFTASSGSRRLEGVPQILILLSGARSFDNVDVPASALKDLGVLIFTIGSRGSDSRELQKISHEPKYALSVSDFTELPNVQEQLVNTNYFNTINLTIGLGFFFLNKKPDYKIGNERNFSMPFRPQIDAC
uniref:VWFA domain-containing protein n=1 Tax=Pygocentrus nattereri TaxID=42514 RepID=A0AAR2J308_PYGNA